MQALLLSLLLATPTTQDAPATTEVPANLQPTLERAAELLVEMQEDYSKADDRKTHLPKAKGQKEWPYEGVYRVRGDIPMGYRIGGTAICATALLEVPGKSSKRKKAIERGLAFILESLEDKSMEPIANYSYDVRGWGHTYALDFLLRMRALKRVPSKHKKRVDEKITWLTKALQDTEITERGGWNYSRRRRGPSDASPFMTPPTLFALFEAKAQGEEVDPAVITRALDGLEGCRTSGGGYPYTTGGGRDEMPGCTARTPITEIALTLAGRGDPKRLRNAIEAFHEHWAELEVRRCRGGTHIGDYGIAPYYVMFGHRYVAMAIELLPEAERAEHRTKLHTRLFEILGQEKNGDAGKGQDPPAFYTDPDPGTWNDRVFPRSRNYGTAFALLALMQPTLPTPTPWSHEE
jgi:hypothetical protein